MTHAQRIVALFLLIVTIAAIGLRPLHAQTITLHSFDGASVANDGRQPAAALVLGTDGNYYGTTQSGGAAGEGTVFKITPAGVITILHSFGDGTVTHDGQQPVAALLSTGDGNFYGTTQYGGTTTATDPAELGYGTAFKMTPAGTVTILHNFGDGSVAHDGQEPVAGLITEGDGSLYGVTQLGGATAQSGAGHLASGNGAVFKMTTSGAVTVLHSFGDGTVANDGSAPLSALKQGTDGNLYGTTPYGGTTTASDPDGLGDGTAFKMTPGGMVTILHSFGDGTVSGDGQTPLASLIQARDGNFYGTTDEGGAASLGTVFEMTATGTVTILHSFGDGTVAADGIYPAASLLQGGDGNFLWHDGVRRRAKRRRGLQSDRRNRIRSAARLRRSQPWAGRPSAVGTARSRQRRQSVRHGLRGRLDGRGERLGRRRRGLPDDAHRHGHDAAQLRRRQCRRRRPSAVGSADFGQRRRLLRNDSPRRRRERGHGLQDHTCGGDHDPA